MAAFAAMIQSSLFFCVSFLVIASAIATLIPVLKSSFQLTLLICTMLSVD